MPIAQRRRCTFFSEHAGVRLGAPGAERCDMREHNGARATALLDVRVLQPAEADVLGLDVLVDAVLAAFAADARLLDAAERRDLGR